MITFNKKVSLEEMIGKPTEKRPIDMDRLRKLGRMLMSKNLRPQSSSQEKINENKQSVGTSEGINEKIVEDQPEQKQKDQNTNFENNTETTHEVVTQSKTASPEKINKQKQSVEISEEINTQIGKDQPQQNSRFLKTSWNLCKMQKKKL